MPFVVGVWHMGPFRMFPEKFRHPVNTVSRFTGRGQTIKIMVIGIVHRHDAIELLEIPQPHLPGPVRQHIVFAIAAMTYLLTMEPSSSLWDCSEFIATSYKLEVGHPPGAPLFMLLARLATILAPSTYYVPHMVNAMNCLASAFCILFLFWTITHLARRILTRQGAELTKANIVAVLGTGAVGALAYTFTDTFWFSAVEGEVYALSSMFTALVVWLMLKWEEQADQPHSMRWIVLIAYLMGLSIGVHILNLLTIPALVFIYYFRKTQRITFKGIAVSTLISRRIC